MCQNKGTEEEGGFRIETSEREFMIKNAHLPVWDRYFAPLPEILLDSKKFQAKAPSRC